MALDFDGWVNALPEDQKNGVNAQLKRAENPDEEKRKLTNIFYLSEHGDVPLHDVDANYDALKSSWAVRNNWGDVWENDTAFHGRVVDQMARERDQRVMVQGEEGDTEAAQATRADSMMQKAYDAGAKWTTGGEDGPLEFATWQEAAKSSPAYDPTKADKYYADWMEKFTEGRFDAEAAQPAAEGAYSKLSQADEHFNVTRDTVPLFRDLTPRQRALAVKGISELAKREGSTVEGQNAGEQMATAFGRVIADKGRSIDRGTMRGMLMATKFKAGDPDRPGTDDEVIATHQFQQGLKDAPRGVAAPAKEFPPMTQERADKLNGMVAQKLNDVDIEAELQDIATGTVNPLRRDTWYQKAALGTAESLGNMATIAIPVVGFGLSTIAYQNDSTEKFIRAGVPRKQAQALGLFAGPIVAMLDKVELSAFTAKFPGMTAWAERFGKNALVNYAGRVALTAGVEQGVETLQNNYVEPAVQSIGRWWDKEIPGVKWEEVNKEAWAQQWDTFMAVLPLSMIGAGAATFRDFKNFRELAGDPLRLETAGYRPEHIKAILQTKTDAEAAALVKQYWPDRIKTEGKLDLAATVAKSSTVGDTASGRPAGDMLPEQTEPSRAPSETIVQGNPGDSAILPTSPTAETQEGSGATPGLILETPADFELNRQAGILNMERDDDGWHLNMLDGKRINVGTVEAAFHARESLLLSGDKKQSEGLVAMADEIWGRDAAAGKKSVQRFTGDVAAYEQGQGVTRTGPKGESRQVEFDPANLDRQLQALSPGATSAIIQGRNWVAEDGVQWYETNQSAEGGMTSVHEFVESRIKDLISGGEGRAMAQAAARAIVPLFVNAKKGDADFAARLNSVADGSASEEVARETLVELVVADQVARRKDGGAFPVGSLSAVLRGGIQLHTGPKAKLAKILSAVRQYLRGIFTVGAKIAKAIRDGKLKPGDDYHVFADKIMGLEPMRRHADAILKDAGQKVSTKESYSMSSADLLEKVAARAELILAEKPEEKLAIGEAISKDLSSMAKAVRFNDVGDSAVDDLKAAQEYEMGAAREDKWSAAERDALEQRHKRAMDALKAKDDKQAMMRSLRALDAMLFKLPAEIRGKVGGFTQLANLETNEAREKFFTKRLAKIEKVVESFLKEEYTDRIEKVFDRAAKGQGIAGEKSKSSVGADAAHLLSAMDAARELDEAGVTARLAAIDSLITGGTLTPEQEALAMRERELVQLAGDWKHADAAQMAAAFKAAEQTAEGGWLEWSKKILQKREHRIELRADLAADTGKTGTPEERDARAKKDLGWVGGMKNWALSLSSFREALEYHFGKESKAAREITDRERVASNTYEDEVQDTGDAANDLFTRLANGKPFQGTQVHARISTPSIDSPKGGKLSELQVIQGLMMWAQEDGRRHMEAFGWDQEGISTLEQQVTKEGRAVYSWLRSRYDAEYAPLNKLYRERHGVNLPGHDNYAPITVTPLATKGGPDIDPVTGMPMTGGILSPGSLRTRSKTAKAKPEFRDALQTYLAHVRQLAHWKAYYDLSVDLSQVFGDRDLGEVVTAKGGDQGLKVLRGWADYFARGGNRDAGAFLALNHSLQNTSGRAAQMILFGRAGTILIQSTQLGAALAEMPTGSYIKRMGKLLAGRLNWMDAMKSEFIQRRFSEAPPIVRQAMQSLASATEPNRIKHAARELGRLIAGADAFFTAGTYAITLDYHRMMGRKMGMEGAALDQYAHAEAVRSTERVAQPTRAANRSLYENTLTNPLARIGWAFASESRQKIAMAAWDFAKAPLGQKLRTAAVVWGAGGLAATIIRGIWRDMKDDDDEDLLDDKNWSLGRIISGTLAGPLSGVPVFGDMAESVFNRTFGLYSSDGDILSQAGDAGTAAKNLVTGKTLESDQPVEDTMKAVKAIMFTMGLTNDTLAATNALTNVIEDSIKVADNLHDDADEAAAKKIQSDSKAKREAKEERTTDEQRDAADERKKARRRRKLDAAGGG